ncbi:hypothetical protein OR16_12268 [Cupriavidus basilensis OR16]|uniref:Uncharacterized protein n=1 Tax=Cupriavidus basilensis OR16 TaxID=1127483 RepID=H1S3V8_9BURK|nr:hypothetical protein OR16_12268 [Cupriavidus basilensis OR16]
MGQTKVLQGLEGRIGAYRDHTVVGAERANPAHVRRAILAELALRQRKQRAAREGHDGIGLGRALRHHAVVGHRADAARHVGQPHRLLGQPGFEQGAQCQLAGQVEATAGLGGHDALRRGGGRRPRAGNGEGEGERCAGKTQGGHDVAHRFSSGVSGRQTAYREIPDKSAGRGCENQA